MSGTTWLTLAETPATAQPPGQDVASLHASAVAELAQALGPHHAALFARPVPSGAGVAWQVQGQDARRLTDLPAESRRAVLAAAGSILSDIRRLVESGRAPAVARAWPALRLVPGLASVFAVDGRPVLTAWAHPPPGGGDPLAAFDDGVAWMPPAPVRWQAWAASLAAAAVLGTLAILFLPQLARWAIPPPAQCMMEPAQLALMRRQAAAEARGNALRGLLATVNDDIGRKQLLCPIPVVQAPAAPAPPPPAPRAELPQDAWERRDLSMLEGCWHNSTQLRTRDSVTGAIQDVTEWKLCFDRGGQGSQTLRWTDGVTCTGPEAASFTEDGTLRLVDRDNCRAPGRRLFRGNFTCRRLNDTEATCTRVTTEGPTPGTTQTGRFTR